MVRPFFPDVLEVPGQWDGRGEEEVGGCSLGD